LKFRFPTSGKFSLSHFATFTYIVTLLLTLDIFFVGHGVQQTGDAFSPTGIVDRMRNNYLVYFS